jgi:hypothetical protein
MVGIKHWYSNCYTTTRAHWDSKSKMSWVCSDHKCQSVCICIRSTKTTDNISQETPVSHYSLKQNDRICNQSTTGQSPLATKWYYHNHKTVPAYWKLWQPVQQLLWLLLYVTWLQVPTICEILCPYSGCDKESNLLRCCAMLSVTSYWCFWGAQHHRRPDSQL